MYEVSTLGNMDGKATVALKVTFPGSCLSLKDIHCSSTRLSSMDKPKSKRNKGLLYRNDVIGWGREGSEVIKRISHPVTSVLV